MSAIVLAPRVSKEGINILMSRLAAIRACNRDAELRLESLDAPWDNEWNQDWTQDWNNDESPWDQGWDQNWDKN